MSAALLFCFCSSFRFRGPQLSVLFQQGLEVLAGKATGHLGHLLGRTLGNHQAAGAAAFTLLIISFNCYSPFAS